jgi:hypothetical protein
LLVVEKFPRHLRSSVKANFAQLSAVCTGRKSDDACDRKLSAIGHKGWVFAMTATPLFGPDMLADPYDMYARIRGPANLNEQMGLWLLTRYDDVRWALGEPQLG